MTDKIEFVGIEDIDGPDMLLLKDLIQKNTSSQLVGSLETAFFVLRDMFQSKAVGEQEKIAALAHIANTLIVINPEIDFFDAEAVDITTKINDIQSVYNLDRKSFLPLFFSQLIHGTAMEKLYTSKKEYPLKEDGKIHYSKDGKNQYFADFKDLLSKQYSLWEDTIKKIFYILENIYWFHESGCVYDPTTYIRKLPEDYSLLKICIESMLHILRIKK